MRKLFAMVATVAVVLSMFSGIAFAAAPVWSVVLTSDASSIITTGDTPGYYFVKGQVQLNGSNYSSGGVITNGIEITGAVTTAVNVNADGTFIYTVPTNGAPGQYVFNVDDDQLGVKGTDTYRSATFERKAIAELSKTTFDYKASPLEVITVSLKDVNGNALKTANIPETLVVLGNSTANASLSNVVEGDGTLAFVVTSWGAGAPGELTLKLAGVAHGTVKVGDIASLAVTADPAATIKKNVQTRLTLNISGPKDLTGVTATAYDPSGNAYNLFTNGTVSSLNNPLDSKGEWKIDLLHTFTTAGTYKVEVTKTGYTKATVNIQVVNGTEGLVESIKTDVLSEIPVGTTTLNVGGADYQVYALDANGAIDATKTIKYSVWVDDVQQADKVAAPAVNLTPSKLGEVKVRIATFVNDVKKLEKVFAVKVTGWDINYDIKTLTVGKAETVTFTVKDKDGNAINNAKIYVGTLTTPKGTLLVDTSTTNVSNGTYVAEDLKYTSPVTHVVSIYKPTTSGDVLMAQFDPGLTVLGENVYSVTSNVETLLSGKKQTVTLTVKDANGNTVLPQRVDLQIGSTVTPNVNFVLSGSSVKVDVQNNGTKDAVIRVMNGAGDKRGEVALKTVAPKVVMVGESKYVTENIYSALKFSVVDPRDDSAILKPVVLTPVNVPTIEVKTADKKGTLTTTLDASAEQNVNVLVSGIDWDAVEEFGDKVTVDVKVTLDATVKTDTTLEVKEAEVVASPETVVLGQPANITLTYKDANGNVITGKKVYFGYVDNANKGTEIGTTDANGQIVYASTAQSSSALTFGFATDISTKQTKKTVASTLDTAAPVVTAPATTDKSTATITISDNVRVTTLYVNGTKVDVIPRASITHVVSLKQGENKIDIVAIDTNYNVVEQTVTITYTPAANNSTVLQGGAVERKGDYVFVQIRQFEDLGATLTWNAAAKTATFVAGGKTVEVTVGSTTAKVNGEAATMPSAPINVGGRVMVPTRFIAEALGWTVDWAAGDIVTITLP